MVAASYRVSVGGDDVTGNMSELLTSLEVRLHATGDTDTARIDLDDTGGQIAIPEVGRFVSIEIGWSGALQLVFEGAVDDVRSSGSRSGRTLTISCKGFDATGGAKSTQARHWDDCTVSTILNDAAQTAGLEGVRVDPDLSSVVLDYWSMLDESLLHMGQRLAQQIGGHFRIIGQSAIMSARAAQYAPTVTGLYGTDLISWDVTPGVARGQFGTVRAPWFDRASGQTKYEEAKTGLASEAVLTIDVCASQSEAKRMADARAATSKRDAGSGRVRINGNPMATVDGRMIIAGARPGVDGSYRIKGVAHVLNRAGGFVTDVELGGKDS